MITAREAFERIPGLVCERCAKDDHKPSGSRIYFTLVGRTDTGGAEANAMITAHPSTGSKRTLSLSMGALWSRRPLRFRIAASKQAAQDEQEAYDQQRDADRSGDDQHRKEQPDDHEHQTD